MNSTNRRHFTIVGVLIVISTFVMQIVLDRSLPLPVQASLEAISIDWLIGLHVWLIAFLFAVVMVFMLYAVVVFRRKEGDESEGEHFEGNTLLEIAWTVAPIALVLIFAVIGFRVLEDVTYAAGDEIEVRVTGSQWSWKFEYPELNDFQSTELVLEVDQRVKFVMTSTDVNHSFWVPEFRVKQDLVNGRETTVMVTPIEVGEYTLGCAELCGTRHYAMLAPVKVLDATAYDAWAAENTK